jgi:hypothetical protein
VTAHPTPPAIDGARRERLAKAQRVRGARLSLRSTTKDTTHAESVRLHTALVDAIEDYQDVVRNEDVILALCAALTDVERRLRSEAFGVSRTAHWLVNDKGYTRRQAAQVLAATAMRLDPDMASKALGDASVLAAASSPLPETTNG